MALPTGSIVVPFWDLPFWILKMNHKKELQRSLWARTHGLRLLGPKTIFVKGSWTLLSLWVRVVRLLVFGRVRRVL